MAQDTREQDIEYVEPEGTVTLVSPNGDEYRTHSPVEINDLVYGRGYKVKDEDAGAAGADAVTATEEPPNTTTDTSAATEAPQTDTEAPAAPAAPSKASAKAAAKPSTSGSPTATPPSTT